MPGLAHDADQALSPDTLLPSARDRSHPGPDQICARQIMSAPVVSVCPETTLRRAIDLMLEADVSGLPVIDAQGALVGILTEGDLLRRTELGTERRAPRWIQYLRSPGGLAEEYAHAHGRRAEAVMSSPVTTVTEDTPLQAIVETLARAGIKRVPVLRGRSVVGMVSRADVVRALGAALDADRPAGDRSDAEIRQDILAEFDRAVCIPKAAIEVAVRRGTVELHGWITDERERGAVRAAVEGVPGVVAVRDHLTWVEPITGTVLPSPDDAEAAATGAAADHPGAPPDGGAQIGGTPP
jgi:CBS domain-containing protein